MTEEEMHKELIATIERAAITIAAGLVRLGHANQSAAMAAAGKQIANATRFAPGTIARELWNQSAPGETQTDV